MSHTGGGPTGTMTGRLPDRRRVIPLDAFEQQVLRLLAANRNPDSYVAGATVLNQNPAFPRTSKDVDVFHDTTER
jgi:hypothetical protein